MRIENILEVEFDEAFWSRLIGKGMLNNKISKLYKGQSSLLLYD